MKEVVDFIVWQWNKWQTWQKWYIAGAFMLGAGVAAPSPYDKILFTIPMIMLFLWTSKWWIWDQLKASWDAYKKEKQELFATIKNSDK
jgi:Sec-independent protein secretion pathway component TatC